MQALLAAVDGRAGDACLRDRYGELCGALSAALAPWIEPFVAAMPGFAPSARSQAAARAVSDLARLTGAFAGDAAERLAGGPTGGAARDGYERYAELAAEIDSAFRDFSSGPEFDRTRRRAAAAVLAWLEHDRAAASGIARILETTPAPAPEPDEDWSRPERVPVNRGDDATLARYPSDRDARASALVVPGFATDARIFDLDPDRSVVRTLAKHGVETWLLDWGRTGASDRTRGVTDQIERIDHAVGVVERAANGRIPALVGHFHGGLLALLYCIRHPGKARALVTLSTPVEFPPAGDGFGDWLRACDGERLAGVFGDVPGALVAALVASMSPMRWCGGGFFALIDGADPGAGATRIARFEHARRFPPAFPGETFRGLYRAFYRDNAFAAEGGPVFDGHRYDLSRLATPLLNVFARDDRVVPPAASSPLATLAKSAPCSDRAHSGGHFDLLIGRPAHAELLPDIAGWLAGRRAHGRG